MLTRRLRQRDRGDIDITDLLVGLGLLIAVPVIVFVIGGLLSEQKAQDGFGAAKEEKPPPPLTTKEIAMRLEVANALLKRNAKAMLTQMNDSEDPILRDRFRSWTERTLTNAVSMAKEMAGRIEAHENRAGLDAYLRKARNIEVEGQQLLREVKALDVLGGD